MALRHQTDLHLILLANSTIDQAGSHGALKAPSCPPDSLPAFTPPSSNSYHGSLKNRMVVAKTMNITMALSSIFRFISLVVLLVPVTYARYLIESASTTPAGLIAIDGLSPRPTLGPRRDKLLEKLQRRADSIISPAPSNWCGFIDGDYGESEIQYSLIPFPLEYRKLFCQNF